MERTIVVEVFPKLFPRVDRLQSLNEASVLNDRLIERVYWLQNHCSPALSLQIWAYSNPLRKAQAMLALMHYLREKGFQEANALGIKCLVYGTPAIVINGEMKFVGRVPTVAELLAAL